VRMLLNWGDWLHPREMGQLEIKGCPAIMAE
jgi:hypothetical protein